VHHLQGKAEGVTPGELQQLLREFYVERLALLLRHEAAAEFITDYDVNNAYQYIIAREETHISWLQHALMDLGGTIPPDPPRPTVRPGRAGDDAVRELSAQDAAANRQFVEKWRARIEQVSNARHKGMLRVILGEMLEHARMFEQASQGRTDIIGTPLPIHERVGKVISTRWIE
jgi:bacterioferritin (cytochrome b1)